MPQTATIKSLPAAFAMMKAMQAEDVECSKAAWPRPSIATSSAWPHAAKPTDATALTRAGC
jgi:hypothetical protein